MEKIKIGIAISTFTEKDTDLKRYEIIEKSLRSLVDYLKNTKLNLFIIIVIDGNIPIKHQDVLQKIYEYSRINNLDNFNIHQREKNGGVARTKNTSIRIILDNNCDIGFLMDDDVLYKKDCFEKYVEAMINGNIPHMGYCQMNPIVNPKNTWKGRGFIEVDINGQKIMKHKGRGVGCLLSFTKELIEKIGYFKVMNGKYGYEHVNFTYRCIKQGFIPHGCDIIDSLEYIDHIGFQPKGINKFNKCHSISESNRKNENNKNKYDWDKNLTEYVKCIEN